MDELKTLLKRSRKELNRVKQTEAVPGQRGTKKPLTIWVFGVCTAVFPSLTGRQAGRQEAIPFWLNSCETIARHVPCASAVAVAGELQLFPCEELSQICTGRSGLSGNSLKTLCGLPVDSNRISATAARAATAARKDNEELPTRTEYHMAFNCLLNHHNKATIFQLQ